MQQDFRNRQLPWRRRIEIAAWIVTFVGSAAANVMVRIVDAERDGGSAETIKYIIWEGSSAASSLLLLPFLLWLCLRWPLDTGNWRVRLPLYLVASVVWSVLHVVGMVLMRMAAYASMGERYGFDWVVGLPYEYLKDARVFAFIVILTHSYHWLWRRLQGEVRLLDQPDPGISTDPPSQPERFLIRKLGREFLVSSKDIEWIKASGNYVNLHVAGRDYPLRATMAEISSRLESRGFVRVHRSFVINLDYLDSIEPGDSGDAELLMRSGLRLPCSRRYREQLRSVGIQSGRVAE